MGIGDWGLGIWEWGVGVGCGGLGPTPQPPIPNPQSPIPNPHIFQQFIILLNFYIINKIYNLFYNKLIKNFSLIKVQFFFPYYF